MLSNRLVLLTCITGILSVFSVPVIYAENIIIMADQSCRTQQSSPDTNVYDSSSLTVRTTTDDPSRTYKSWIKFDISELDVNRLETATLTITLAMERGIGEYFRISYVNDDCLDNIGWDSDSLTWNNAPGNIIDNIKNRIDLVAPGVDFLNDVGGIGDRFFEFPHALNRGVNRFLTA